MSDPINGDLIHQLAMARCRATMLEADVERLDRDADVAKRLDDLEASGMR